MTRQHLACGVAAAVFGLGLGAANAKCSVLPTRGLTETSEVEGGLMTVQAGTVCGLSIMGIERAIDETKITKPPRVGRVEVRGNTVVYAAKPGFKGEDEFTYAHLGTTRYGGPMSITIRRKVDVVP